MTTDEKKNFFEKARSHMGDIPAVLVANAQEVKPTYEQLDESCDYLADHLAYAYEQHDEVVKKLADAKLRADTAEEARMRLVDENTVLRCKAEDLERGIDAQDTVLTSQYNEVVKTLAESRVNFAAAYNALRNIRLYLRKHVDDIPYECRETLKRFCDAGGCTDTVLRASSSDLADVAFPKEA